MAKNNGALALAPDYEELEKLTVAENTMAGKRYQRYRNGGSHVVMAESGADLERHV